MFSERKVAQMAAWFLAQAGGQMPVLKLMKLLYLADRESMNLYDAPMTFDFPVSMPHGPVLSRTLDLINGCQDFTEGGWEDWVQDRAGHRVEIKISPLKESMLGQLSQADLEILSAVWNRFGQMGQWQIRDYTHDQCAEWQDPQGSSRPIPFQAIAQALGRAREVAREIEQNIQAQIDLSGVLAGA